MHDLTKQLAKAIYLQRHVTAIIVHSHLRALEMVEFLFDGGLQIN